MTRHVGIDSWGPFQSGEPSQARGAPYRYVIPVVMTRRSRDAPPERVVSRRVRDFPVTSRSSHCHGPALGLFPTTAVPRRRVYMVHQRNLSSDICGALTNTSTPKQHPTVETIVLYCICNVYRHTAPLQTQSNIHCILRQLSVAVHQYHSRI